MVQTDDMRERMFTMRLSKEESDRLDALAEHFGINAVGIIRMLLKEKARELGMPTISLGEAALIRQKAGIPASSMPYVHSPKRTTKKPAK